MCCDGKKGRSRAYAAYFTVEVSLVFPIVLFVMVLLIHFAFYLYGRCILSQDTYLLAFRASRVDEEVLGMDRQTYLTGIADAQFGKKYFGNGRPVLQIAASEKELRLHTETEASHRAMSASSLMPAGSWAHGTNARAEILDPAERIRKLDRMADVAARIYETIKEK